MFGAPPGLTLIGELNVAATEGDGQRVKWLLAQLLHCPNQGTDDPIPLQVAALEQLFYALRALALTDELTGVYNRRGFEWAAGQLLRHCEHGALLLYFDVDDLKVVNDTLGHAAGDLLLTATGAVLRSACGDHAVIGRIGGDEFVAVVRLFDDQSHGVLCRRLCSAVSDCNATGRFPPLSLSIGAVEFDPLRPASVWSLVERADRAMYAEKFSDLPPQLAATA
jgi:diguanylate cyclase (GGDEF)-like protein